MPLTKSLQDATNSFDQARFFQENAEQVFQVVYDTCIHQIEKIKRKSKRWELQSTQTLNNNRFCRQVRKTTILEFKRAC